MTGEAQFDAGIKALKAGRAVDARAQFQSSIDAGLDTAQLWLGFTLACVMQGDLVAAEAAVDQVLSREGKNLRALIIKGDLLAGRNDEQWVVVRSERNIKLQASDWSVLPDVPITPEKKTEWETYRQALRDITNQPDPFNITWPTPPE